MGVFDDHKYDKLDWMTQMTETIDSELNVVLAQLPDRIEITPAMVRDNLGSFLSSISVQGIIARTMINMGHGGMEWEETQAINRCFRFEASGNVEYDFSTDTVSGDLTLVKVVGTIEDRDLQPLMGVRGINTLYRTDWGIDPSFTRFNEVLEILGVNEEEKHNRSVRKKVDAIGKRLRSIFANNEWRIRDMDLANDLCTWVRSYIKDGRLDALVKITKLKVMTHSNMPIYSVKEE